MHQRKFLRKLILFILCLQLVISGLIIGNHAYASDDVIQGVIQSEEMPVLQDDIRQDAAAGENTSPESGDGSNTMPENNDSTSSDLTNSGPDESQLETPDLSSSISSGNKTTDAETKNNNSDSEKLVSGSKDTEKNQSNTRRNADKDNIKKDKPDQKETGNEKGSDSTRKIIAKTISIPVQKKWVGPSLDAVTIRLYADGKEKASAVLTESNGWKYSFSSLPVYDPCDGHLIVYIVKEDTPANYLPSYYYDKCNGYIITNYNREKTDIDVSKHWVGPSTDSVTVKLLADNHILFVKCLTAENNWHHTFTNLPKYSLLDGHKIDYEIKEIPVDGYVSKYSFSEEGDYIITNISTETINIPVEKQWIGEEKESVTVRLLADGVEIDNIILNSESDWKYTFAELPVYDVSDGHKYNYLIEEDPVENYKAEISGTSTEGFIITNTKIDPEPTINTDDPEDPAPPENPVIPKDPQNNENIDNPVDPDNPDLPKQPEDSKKPEKPKKPQETKKPDNTSPTKPSQKTGGTTKPNTSSKNAGAPKTGDDNSAGLWLILSMASGGMLLSLMLKRNRNR